MRPISPLPALAFFLGSFVASHAQVPATPGVNPANSVLWYAQPARTWMTEALPLGNGCLGGMFFGLTAATVRNVSGTTAKIRYGDRTTALNLKPGQSATLDVDLQTRP